MTTEEWLKRLKATRANPARNAPSDPEPEPEPASPALETKTIGPWKATPYVRETGKVLPFRPRVN
jgi:hypothetical protein